jgi:hypothetical protein
LGSGIRKKTYSGSRGQKGTGSRILIHNTNSCARNEEATRLRAGDLLEALTLKSADELFDMEKMEIVGDVFLKFRCNCLCWFADITPPPPNPQLVSYGSALIFLGWVRVEEGENDPQKYK